MSKKKPGPLGKPTVPSKSGLQELQETLQGIDVDTLLIRPIYTNSTTFEVVEKKLQELSGAAMLQGNYKMVESFLEGLDYGIRFMKYGYNNEPDEALKEVLAMKRFFQGIK